MIFSNRENAARLLVHKLNKFRNKQPIVLAIPRGAVPMGKLIADELRCDFDVVLVRKIGAPDNPEFAIGAVSEFGNTYLSEARDLYGYSDEYLQRAVAQEMKTIKKRRAWYTPMRQPVSPSGRTVIIIDDGIATGATMLAAVRSVRNQKAKCIIVAAPVASQEAAKMLGKEADEVIFLDVPRNLRAISQFYEEFPEVSDEEVAMILSSPREVAA
ncbi:phosphoribosyltransferase family protein [Bdellovibrionota bacterium FG-2]